jgi:transposase-like protein
MTRKYHLPYSAEFKEQALSKAKQRGTRTLEAVANELSMSLGTLKRWFKVPGKKMGSTQAVEPQWASLPRSAADGEARSLKFGSVRMLRPLSCHSAVEWPIQVTVTSRELDFKYAKSGVMTLTRDASCGANPVVRRSRCQAKKLG